MRSNKLLVITIFLVLLSAAAFLFVLNTEKFIYPAILPLNPYKNSSITSFAVSQKYYAVVDNIEETEKDGETYHIVALAVSPDEDLKYGGKNIQIEYDKLAWDHLPQTITYWNTDKSTWDNYNEKSGNIKGGLEIGNTVVVNTDTYYSTFLMIDQDRLSSFSRIISVFKESNE